MKSIIKKLLREGLLDEVSSDVYSMIGPNDRVIMSKFEEINFNNIDDSAQEIRFKPRGLWYGIGTEWIDWVRGEMPEWESEHVFIIKVNEPRIKIIRTLDEIDAFTKEYGSNEGSSRYRMTGGSYKDYSIDWRRVAADYDGIEIAPYNYRARNEYIWYYGWDVASGCIWNKGALQDIKRIS
jgi:hypothetical protein